MARLPVKIICDRMDLAAALFHDYTLDFVVHNCATAFSSVRSILKTDYLRYEVDGILLFGGDYYNGKLICTTEHEDAMLTVDVGDPKDDENTTPFERLCLRCPKCGSKSRPAEHEPKMYEGASIRECTVCRDTCAYDDECTWPYRFTVQNLEGRPEHYLTLCDDPQNHA